jgi:hypothetical protein
MSQAGGLLFIEVRAPQLSSPSNLPPLELGDSFDYQVTVTHPTSSFTITGLPPGFQFNSSTGVITGTATVAGSYYAYVTAQTNFGPASGYITITILAPHLTSSFYPPAVPIGSTLSYQIAATNHPMSFAATGLPSGFTLNAATGLISGIATLSGTFQLLITAHGANGDASNWVTFTVGALPSYTLPSERTAVLNAITVVSDPLRPRLYMACERGLYVIDSTSLAIIHQFEVPGLL